MSVLCKIACRTCIVAMTACVLLPGCTAPTPSEQAPTQSPDTGPSFVNKVWSVQSSNTVTPGQLYVFLSEGTLLITSSHGKPALGTWEQRGGTFTMIEEGIAYQVEILGLTPDRFSIRIRNPGEPVEMTLVPAAQ